MNIGQEIFNAWFCHFTSCHNITCKFINFARLFQDSTKIQLDN